MKNYYYISTGDLNGFYTLRHTFTETCYSRTENGGVESFPVERDWYIRNLSTDREEAIEKASAWADENNIPANRRLFRAEFDLAEIKRRSAEEIEASREREAERIRTTDWSILPFGKYAGKSLRDLVTTDPEYVSFVATWNSGDGQHCAKVAAELIAPYLAAKNAEKSSRIDKIIAAFGRNILERFADDQPHQFAGSVSREILKGNIPSDRAINILSDIAAKLTGRRNSKAYNARYQEIIDALPA